MGEFLTWQIVLRDEVHGKNAEIPQRIITVKPGFQHENMPNEIGILLPGNEGPAALIDAVVAAPSLVEGAVMGIFLASPFLRVDLDAPRLRQAGIDWIANLPSVGQYGKEFSEQLEEVGLGLESELSALAQYKEREFSVAAVVVDEQGACAAAKLLPQAMIVMPSVTDFAAVFPSLNQRGNAVQAISTALAEDVWDGLLLCLGDPGEVAHPRQWPTGADGLVIRPSVDL